MKKKISFQWIIKQLKADLIGKDSHRGITLTYAWLANQFGHISLGFIPSILLFAFLKDSEKFSNPLFSSLFVSGFWLLFEAYNFLGPLLTKKKSSSKLMYVSQKKSYVFNPKWKNVAFDTFTDVCFFALGAFLFSLFTVYNRTTIIIIIALALYLAFATSYWFITKMFQMNAFYPFQFRLSQWSFSMDEENKKTILSYLETENIGNHLLIFGAQNKGKTSLAVGLANELSIKHKACLYKNAIKLYGCFYEDKATSNTDKIWDWKSTDTLVIDDINAGQPIVDELVNANLFLSFIDANKNNRALLTKKNIIWVLGSYNEKAPISENSWYKMLLEIGVSSQKITTVNLQ